MAKSKKRQPMPKWIWQLNPKLLNYKLKHLLSYIWWCGDKGCRDWNYKIAKRFTVSDRTIKRWIKKLADMRLIYINFPHKRSRTIYRRPYFSMNMWLYKRGMIKELPKKSQEAKVFSHKGTKVAYISNAQRLYCHKTDNTNALVQRSAGKNHPSSVSGTAKRLPEHPRKTSSAGRLGGSRMGAEKLAAIINRTLPALTNETCSKTEKIPESE